MNKDRLACRIFSFNIPLLVFLYVLFIALYIMILLPVIPDSNSTHAQDNIFIVVCVGGMAVVILFPLFFSGNTSHCVIENEGIKQKKKYCFGLLPISSTIPWNKVICWDRGFVYNPLVSEKVPRIRLFLRKGLLRLDKTNKHFSISGDPTDWDHFQAGVSSLLYSKGIPAATPEHAVARLRNMKIAFLVAAIIIGVLLITGGILSIVTGKISFSLIFAGTMFFVIFTGACTRLFKPK